jgi:hypothetical protein
LSLPTLDATNLAVALLYVGLFARGLIQFTDPDYGWHVTTGRLIVENGAIPRLDPFTFTSADKHWVTHEWLAEVIMYGVQSLAGYGANVLLFTGMAVAALAIVHRTALSLGAPRWSTTLLVSLAALMSLSYWTVRPQVFTWLLFAVFLAVLVGHRRGARRQIWLLPPLMLLWTNLHLGHAIGLGMVVLYVFATALESRAFRVERDLRTPAVVLAACLVAMFVNPNTVDQVAYPLQYLRPGNANVELITEWRSPDFHEPGHIMLAVGILAYVAAGVYSVRHDLFLPTLALAFTYFALQSIRHQPLFALVFVVAMAACLAERPFWGRLEGRLGSRSAVHARFNLALLGAAVLTVGLMLMNLPGVQLGASPRLNGSPYYPEAGAAFIEASYPEARVFNTFIWGGYLTSELYPQRVFIDGRSDLHGGDLYRDYLSVVGLAPDWQALLDAYAVDLVIIESGSSLADALAQADQWQRVFSGPGEVVYVRDAP